MEKQIRTRDIKETDRGLLLRKKEDSKLSWENIYKAMADEKEDWDDENENIGY